MCKHPGHRRFLILAVFGTVILLGLVSASHVQAGFSSDAAVITYQVQENDTLYTIGQRFNVSHFQIAEKNGFPRYLMPGQTLYLPVTVTDGGFSYRVQKGDSLFIIANRVGRSLSAIKQKNNLIKAAVIYPDKILQIPVVLEGETIWQVSRGDTLYKISRQTRIPVKTIMQSNRLSDTELRLNQILRISTDSTETQPQPPSDDNRAEMTVYRVNKGDTLKNIGRWFGTTVSAIKETNQLRSERLMPGQPLFIPVNSSTGVSVKPPQYEQVDGYGKLLDWKWARWYYPPGTNATVIDFYTGKKFDVVRLGGSNHADSEPRTAQATAVMGSIVGWYWSWQARPILLEVEGKVFAASMNTMPHGVQFIGDNNFPGHFCIYFYNSRTHNTDSLHDIHQFNVLRAAGHR